MLQNMLSLLLENDKNSDGKECAKSTATDV